MAGERPRFEDLYRDFLHRIHAFVRAQLPDESEAEDVTADTFLRAYRAYGRYRPERDSPAAWLFTIARNGVLDRHRSHARERRALTVLAHEPVADRDPAAEAQASIEVAGVLETLRTLPERDREVIALRQAGLAFAEVGEVCGLGEDAAKMAYHRALRRLRERLPR